MIATGCVAFLAWLVVLGFALTHRRRPRRRQSDVGWLKTVTRSK